MQWPHITLDWRVREGWRHLSLHMATDRQLFRIDIVHTRKVTERTAQQRFSMCRAVMENHAHVQNI